MSDQFDYWHERVNELEDENMRLNMRIHELEAVIEQMVDAKDVFAVWELANQAWQRILDRQEPPR